MTKSRRYNPFPDEKGTESCITDITRLMARDDPQLQSIPRRKGD